MSDLPKRRARWLLMAFVAVMVSVLTVAWTSMGAGRAVSEQAEELAGQRIPELREIAELQSARGMCTPSAVSTIFVIKIGDVAERS